MVTPALYLLLACPMKSIVAGNVHCLLSMQASRKAFGWLSLLCLVCGVMPAAAQELESLVGVQQEESVWRETIRIHSNGSGYTSEIEFVANADEGEQIDLFFGELEKLDDLKVTYRDQKYKIKKIKSSQIVTSDYDSDIFFSGYRTTSFVIPEESSYKVSYTVKSNELMLLSSLPLRTNPGVERIEYKLLLPEGWKGVFNWKDDLTKSVRELDSAQVDTNMVYRFWVKVSQEDDLDRTNYYRSGAGHAVRMSVYPEGYEGGATGYFNDWHRKLVATQQALSPELIAELDVLLKDQATEEDSLKAIFAYAQRHIRYIDIENGLGAFQPRPVSWVHEQKMGDCKDMSNWIHCSLSHYGFESRLAISSTLNHRFPMDFPSLSSANHVICLARYKDSWIPFDATEDDCAFGYPSRQIQDRNVFVTGEGEGYFYKIPSVSATENEARTNFDLTVREKEIAGDFICHWQGISAIPLMRIERTRSEEQTHTALEKVLDAQAEGVHYTVSAFEEKPRAVQLKGKAEVSASLVNKVGSKNYLTLRFMNAASNLPDPLDTTGRLFTYETINKVYETQLHFEQDVSLTAFEPVDYQHGDFHFSLHIEQLDAREIQVTCAMKVDAVQFSGEDLVEYLTWKTLIEKNLNRFLIYVY